MERITHPVAKSRLTVMLSFGLASAITLVMWFPRAFASEDPSQGSPSSAAQGARPVELPSVQEANCKKQAAGLQHEQCLRVSGILAAMSAERRQAAWADRMESFLRKWIETLEPDGFTFRNVECRLSWCVIEAGSTIGAGTDRGHSIVLDVDEADKRKIFQTENMFARDADGAGGWDVVVIFKRYCTSARELFDSDNNLAPNFYTLGQKC